MALETWFSMKNYFKSPTGQNVHRKIFTKFKPVGVQTVETLYNSGWGTEIYGFLSISYCIENKFKIDNNLLTYKLNDITVEEKDFYNCILFPPYIRKD